MSMFGKEPKFELPKKGSRGVSIPAPQGNAPTNTVLPVITGVVALGNVLSVTSGTWTNSPGTLLYQWQRNLVDIPGAAFTTYTCVNADLGQSITCTVTAFNQYGSGFATSLPASLGSSSGPVFSIGQNLSFNTWYEYNNLTVDILHAEGIYAVDGALGNGVVVPAANRDANGNPISLPGGKTYFQMYLGSPVSNGQVALRYSGTPGTIFLKPDAIQASAVFSAGQVLIDPTTINEVAGGAAPVTVYWTPGASPPTNWTCRPVSDPGGYVGSAYSTTASQLVASNGALRPLHPSAVESNLGTGSAADPLGNSTFSGYYYPVNGDNKLAENILTATTRNTLVSPDWNTARDHMPIEAKINICNALNRDLYLNLEWNGDDTFYNKIFDVILNGNAGQSVSPLASNLKVYLVIGNEVWNGGYLVSQQCKWEARHRGEAGQPWSTANNHTACRVVATGNITLSGTQTIDGVAVVAGDRVLCVGQTNPVQNGPYVVAAGAWSRAADTVASKDMWYITAGTAGAVNTYRVRTTGTITLGTTSLSITPVQIHERYAEKSVAVFKLAETAFSAVGQRSRLLNGLEWQNVASSGVFTTMLDWEDVDAHTDFLATAWYYSVNDTTTYSPSYTGDPVPAIATMYANIDAGYAATSAHKAVAIARNKQFLGYEGGAGDTFTDETFMRAIRTHANRGPVQHYWGNEGRRLLGTTMVCYHDIIDRINTGTGAAGGTFGLLEKVNDPIDSTNPLALAVKQLNNSQFMLFDPTITITGGTIYDNASIGTVVATIDKGLLPEADYTLINGGTNFSLITNTDANGAKRAQIIKNAATVTAGTYNTMQIVQTPQAGVSVLNGPTKTTNVPAVTITVHPNTYRAMRFRVTAVNGASQFAANEVQWNTSIGGATVLTGATIVSQPSDDGVHVGSLLIDGSDFTGTAATLVGTFPGSVTYIWDLGSNPANWKTLAEIRINSGNFAGMEPTAFTCDFTTDDPAGSPTWVNKLTQSGVSWPGGQTGKTWAAGP